MDELVNDEYQFDDMILSDCRSSIKMRSILKLKEQIAHYQDHLSVLLQAKDSNKVDHKAEINRLKTDNLFQTTQNDTLRLQITGSRDENENHRASKTEESAKD